MSELIPLETKVCFKLDNKDIEFVGQILNNSDNTDPDLKTYTLKFNDVGHTNSYKISRDQVKACVPEKELTQCPPIPHGTKVWFKVNSHRGIRFVGQISDSSDNKKIGSRTTYTLRCKINDDPKDTSTDDFRILRTQVTIGENQFENSTKCPQFTDRVDAPYTGPLEVPNKFGEKLTIGQTLYKYTVNASHPNPAVGKIFSIEVNKNPTLNVVKIKHKNGEKTMPADACHPVTETDWDDTDVPIKFLVGQQVEYILKRDKDPVIYVGKIEEIKDEKVGEKEIAKFIKIEHTDKSKLLSIKHKLTLTTKHSTDAPPELSNTPVTVTVNPSPVITMSTTNSRGCEAFCTDLISYFKKYICKSMREQIEILALEKYILPYHPKKSILVHLRLGDVKDRPDYDGSICSNHYKNRIDNDNQSIQGIATLGYCNMQTPLARNKVDLAIMEAKQKYPEHEVIIVTAPGDYEINYPYRCIRSDDESYDMFLLCNADVLILSRSTFSLSAAFLGIANEVWCPLWGHFVCTGLYTKYDNSKFNYFF